MLEPAQCPKDAGSLVGMWGLWWMCQLLSSLQVRTVEKLGTWPWDTGTSTEDVYMSGHTHCHRQGTATDSPQGQGWVQTDPHPPQRLAQRSHWLQPLTLQARDAQKASLTPKPPTADPSIWVPCPCSTCTGLGERLRTKRVWLKGFNKKTGQTAVVSQRAKVRQAPFYM